MRVTLQRLSRFGLGRILSIVLLLCLVAGRVWDPAPVEALRHRAFDIFQLVQPRESVGQPVIIVDIDERSLQAMGQWPWPRTVLADMVKKIAESGSVAIGFDVLFAEPDRSSPDVVATTIRGISDEMRQSLGALPGNDAVFADAIRGHRVILGQSGYRVTGGVESPMPSIQTGIATIGPDPRSVLVRFPRLLRNLPSFEDAASGRGLFSFIPEGDGTVRRVPLVATAGGTIVPSLALEILRVTSGSDAILLKSDEAGLRSVGIKGLEIPTDGKGRVWIHFSAPGTVKYVSALDVIQGKVGSDQFNGKIVLVGTSAAGLLDLKITPLDPATPGVELHAQILESALSQSTISRPPVTAVVEIALAILLASMLILLAPKVNAGVLFLLGGLVATMTVGFSWYCFAYRGLLIDYSFPLASSLLVYSVLVFTNYMTVTADRHRIRSAFGQYISRDLVEQLAHSPEKLTLGGEQRELTVLFCDVRGFTSISEGYKDNPQGLTALINQLFTPLTNDILKRKGTIDKYMGDAIMAFWNAPLFDSSHELNACDAALAMLTSLALINEARAQASLAGEDAPPLRIGIGLNTGLCVVGNFGSELHFNYSALGDTVNIASRLEGLSKLYGLPIIIGERTASAAQGRFAVLELDQIQVRGKTAPERIFTILGRAGVVSDEHFRNLSQTNELMLTAYRSQDWTTALEAILVCREAGRRYGLDHFYSLYADRVRDLIARPPPEGWVGVAAAESK